MASPASGAASFSQDGGRTEGPSVLWAWPSARRFTCMKETVLVHKLQWEKIERCLFSITLILAPFSWDGRNLPHRDPRGACLRSPEWWLTACPRPGPTWASREAWALQLPVCRSSGRDSQPSHLSTTPVGGQAPGRSASFWNLLCPAHHFRSLSPQSEERLAPFVSSQASGLHQHSPHPASRPFGVAARKTVGFPAAPHSL